MEIGMKHATEHYTTIPKMVVLFQVPPHRIEQIVGRLKLAPVLVLNSTRYFDTAAIESIHAELMKGETRVDKRRAAGESRTLRN